MVQTILLAFAGALLVGNGLPHFIQGITKKPYPCVMGNTPVMNLLAGWSNFIFGGFLLQLIDVTAHRNVALIAMSIGLLLAGLFHASIGSIGRDPNS